MSARSTGFGANLANNVRRYGDFNCPAGQFNWAQPGVPLGTPVALPATAANTVHQWVIDFPTTEPIRIVNVNIPVVSVTAGYFAVSFISTSENQPGCAADGLQPNGIVCNPTTPWALGAQAGPGVGLPGQGPYQMAPLIVPVAAGGATTIVLPVNFELGAGWTGRLLIAPSTGLVFAPTPFLPSAASHAGVCFSPLLTAPVSGGIGIGPFHITMDLTRGGPLGYVSAMTGTSSAAALVAGEAALVRQYFSAGFYPSGVATPANGFAPSAALLKATLINSASPISQVAFNAIFGIANPPANQLVGNAGLGVPNLVRGLSFAALGAATRAAGQLPTLLLPGITTAPGTPAVGVDPSFSVQGQQSVFCVEVAAAAASSLPLSATLVWTDPVSANGAFSQLVNNMDLIIQPPVGPIAFGNTANVSAPNQVADLRNNVEVITYAAPIRTLAAAGGARLAPAYRVTVRATGLPVAPQAFSLVITGPGVSWYAPDAAGQCTGPAPAPAGNNNAAAATVTVPAQQIAIVGGVLGAAFLLAAGAAVFFYLRASAPSAKPAWEDGKSTPNALRAATNQAIELPVAARKGPAVAEWGAAASPLAPSTPGQAT